MRLHYWLFGGLLALGMISAIARAATTEEDFELGVAAFEAGRFADAKRHFDRARGAGLDSSALYYNLGVTLFKLGLYAEAQSAFAACARDPAWAALAHYNMGLAALQQGDQAAATGYFSRAWRTADDDKLTALALTMLERVKPDYRRIPQSRVAIGLGYDSNVVLSDQALVLPATRRSDSYLEALAATGASLTGGSIAPRWHASIYDLRYSSLSDYNISALQMGLDIPWQQDARFWSVGGQGGYLWRNGSPFQQIGMFRLATSHNPRPDQSWRVEFRYEQVDSTDPAFRFLEGRRVNLDISNARPFAGGRMNLGLLFEHNNREDEIVGADFYSYSPNRAGIRWRGAWTFRSRWNVEPLLRYRYSRYADEDRHGGVVKIREDNDWQTGLAVRYRLADVWQLTGEYAYTINRSNFDEFSYSRHQVSVGVTRPL